MWRIRPASFAHLRVRRTYKLLTAFMPGSCCDDWAFHLASSDSMNFPELGRAHMDARCGALVVEEFLKWLPDRVSPAMVSCSFVDDPTAAYRPAYATMPHQFVAT